MQQQAACSVGWGNGGRRHIHGWVRAALTAHVHVVDPPYAAMSRVHSTVVHATVADATVVHSTVVHATVVDATVVDAGSGAPVGPAPNRSCRDQEVRWLCGRVGHHQAA